MYQKYGNEEKMTSVELRKTESNSTVSQQPGFELVTRRDSGRGETLGEMEPPAKVDSIRLNW